VKYTGIYCANSWTKVSDITDGTSTTLAFGEAMGGRLNNGTREFKLSWLGTGWLPTKWGLAPSYGPEGKDYIRWQFQSRHGGIVYFAWADGHVSGISPTAAYWNYIAASGMADGVPLPADF
jgi:prepilin-type processing-associated H-X9-DG protein